MHFFAHLLLFAASMVMWFPVVNRMPEYPQLGQPAKMVYLFVQSLLPTIPASFLTFGSTPVYAFYSHVPRIWGISVMTDQLIAGLTMKLVGGAILWGVMSVVFFRWAALEDKGWDALAWHAVERDVRTGLRRRDREELAPR